MMPTSSFRFFTVVIATSITFTFFGLHSNTAMPEKMKIIGRPITGQYAGKIRAPMIRTIITTNGMNARSAFHPAGASGSVASTSSTAISFFFPRVR